MGGTSNSARAAGAFAAAALIALLAGCGGDPGTKRAATTSTASTAERPPPGRDRHAHGDSTRAAVRQAVAESPKAELDAAQRRVARTVDAYVAALDAREGARVCALFVPGALDHVRFPKGDAGCARSVSASVGYRDPRGFPVYERARVARVSSVVITGETARVTATVVTRFAGDREPSVEDDLVYLRAEGDRWLIAKPSATLYRAIGAGDIPPTVLAPP